MSTKDNYHHFLPNNDKSFDNEISTFNQKNQFKNINLNQNNKFKDDAIISKSSKSKLSKNGRNDYDFVDSSDLSFAKNASNSWKKNGDICKTFKGFNISDFQKEQNQWKNADEKNSSAKNSTLSLHIAAYENAIEILNDEVENKQFKKETTMVKTWKNSESISTFSSVTMEQNPFEFPRQEKNGGKTPEVMKFRASKKLLNPNSQKSNESQRKNAPGTNNQQPQKQQSNPAKSPPTNLAQNNNNNPSSLNATGIQQEDPASTWSWFPSFFTSLFISSTPEKKVDENVSSIPQQQQPPPISSHSLAFSTTKIPITENINEQNVSPSFSNGNPALQQSDVDEKSSRGNGDASPQPFDNGIGKNKSKELISTDLNKKKFEDKDIIVSKSSEATMISVNLEEGSIPDAMLKELIPQPEIIIKQEKIPKLKDVFELEASAASTGAVSTEPAIKPKCSFNRVSFSRSHTVYFLPNTKQRLHKKVVRSRHDAWRRYGALMVIHKRGGWSYTMNGKAKNFQKVDKDTPLPPAPVLPPILTEEEFHRRPLITIASSNSSKSKRQRQARTENEKKESKGDTDTSVSEEEPPSC